MNFMTLNGSSDHTLLLSMFGMLIMLLQHSTLSSSITRG